MKQLAIVCVDDDSAILNSLEMELNKIVNDDYLVEMADSAEECLELCRELLENGHEIALVISDYIMPNIPGDELLRQVHQLSPSTLTIMLTGQAGLEALGNAIRHANLYRYISKPWEFEDFKLTVTEALRSYRQEQKLIAFYAGLEEKIAQRTWELQQKNASLLKLSQERNEFLAIAAHDLKNPLSAIQGLAELIINDYQILSQQEVVDTLKMIVNSSKQMFDIVDNILQVNAIESEKMKVSLQEVDILSTAHILLERYANQARAKNISLHFSHQEEAYYAQVDLHLVVRVFDNLISNAIKYSPFDKNVYVKLSRGEKVIHCEIQDEGPGLSEDDQKKLFGKFSRLTPIPTAQENSTGLGLFIVKKLVEAMQGRVWCESELGKGSCFVVEFLAASSHG